VGGLRRADRHLPPTGLGRYQTISDNDHNDHNDHNGGHDERGEQHGSVDAGKAAGGRVLDFPGTPAAPFTNPPPGNGGDPDRDPAMNASGAVTVNGAGTGAVNAPADGPDGPEGASGAVVGPVVDGEIVTDPPDDTGGPVRVDGPDPGRDVGYLERVRAVKRRPLLPRLGDLSGGVPPSRPVDGRPLRPHRRVPRAARAALRRAAGRPRGCG